MRFNENNYPRIGFPYYYFEEEVLKYEQVNYLLRNQKALKGFKNLREVKLNKTQIIVNPGNDGAPDQIVGILLRKHLKNFTTKLAKKFQ